MRPQAKVSNAVINCALAGVASVLVGCAIRPPPDGDEIRADTLAHAAVPPHWTAANSTTGAVADGWLKEFSDPVLESYVREALAYNVDLQTASARVEQARHQVTAAGATLYPAVNAAARGGTSDADPAAGWTGAVIAATWELDVWGRVRASRAAATEDFGAAEGDLAYARQSIAALTAKGWFTATEAQLQLVIATDAVRAAEQLLYLTQERRRLGAGSDYDIAVAQASLGSFRDTHRQLQLAYQQALRALETLLGRYPAAAIAPATALPAMPSAVPVGLPSELLERRPDVVAAERRVAAAFNRVQEAKAARLPSISLTAAFSSISSDLFVLQDRDNPVWSGGASLLAPLFRGGELKAQEDIRTAEQKQALADYASVGLRAFNEVETALANEFALIDRENILKGAVADHERALKLAQVRYRQGSGDLRDVSQQQLSLYAARTALLRVQSEARLQRVNLHLALGGSFAPPQSAGSAGSSTTTMVAH